MSIWCSGEEIGYNLDRKKPKKVRGEVRSYAAGWSNHYPDRKVEQPASVSTAAIAPFCVPGHDQRGENYGCSECGTDHDHPEMGPWLRLDIDSPFARHWVGSGRTEPDPIHASVVLDEEAARILRDELTEWLDAPKVHPTEEP